MSSEKGHLEPRVPTPHDATDAEPQTFESYPGSGGQAYTYPPQRNYGFQGDYTAPPADQSFNQGQTTSHQTNYAYEGGVPAPQVPKPQYQGQTHYGYNNVVVTQVGGVGGAVYQTPPVDYSTQALFACLCCFWPLGLVAMMKASESRDAVARGDMVAAHASANSARQMVKLSVVIGIASLVLAGVIFGVYFGVVWNNLYSY